MTISGIALSFFLFIQSGTASIEGIVVSATTNKPIPDAQITGMKTLPGITLGRPPQTQPVATDSNGHFILRNLEAGRYTLRASADGYARQQYGPPPVGQTGMTITITLNEGQAVKGVTFHLIPGGNVTGRVTGSSGQPLANIEVALLRPIYDFDGKRFIESATAQTDDRGEYRLFWVPPGRYYLSAGSPSRQTAARNPILGQVGGSKYARTFYPATLDPATAAAIDVQPGGEVGGMDFRLTEQSTYRVRGRVVDSTTGQIPRNALIAINRRTSMVMVGSSSTGAPYNSTDGTFELLDVPSGSYWVIAQLSFAAPPRPQPGERPPRPPMAVASVDVNGADIDGVVLTVLPPVTISGRIRVEEQVSGLDRLSIILSNPQPGFGPIPIPLPAKVNADGTFQVEGVLPGEYRLNVVGLPSDPQSTLYVKDARFGSVDALNQTFTVSGPVSEQLEIVCATDGGHVAGTVSDNRLQPLSSVQVALVPDRRERRDLYRFTVSDADGRFTFPTVPPGTYKIFTVQELDASAFYDPEVIRLFEQDGKAVTIGKASVVTVDVKPALSPSR